MSSSINPVRKSLMEQLCELHKDPLMMEEEISPNSIFTSQILVPLRPVLPLTPVERFKELSQRSHKPFNEKIWNEKYPELTQSEVVKRNRYPNVVPTTLDLVSIQHPIKGSKYINANYFRDLILTQGPFIKGPINTVIAFWLMALENVTDVVCLTEECVGNVLKCYPYWFGSAEYDVELENGEIIKLKITVLEPSSTVISSKNNFEKVTTKRFKIEFGNESKEINFWHFENWPDGKDCDPVLLAKFFQLLMNKGLKIAVNCSAGIGRTGVFATLYHLLKEYLETGELPGNETIDETIVDGRNRRPGLVQTPEQLELISKTLKEFDNLEKDAKRIQARLQEIQKKSSEHVEVKDYWLKALDATLIVCSNGNNLSNEVWELSLPEGDDFLKVAEITHGSRRKKVPMFSISQNDPNVLARILYLAFTNQEMPFIHSRNDEPFMHCLAISYACAKRYCDAGKLKLPKEEEIDAVIIEYCKEHPFIVNSPDQLNFISTILKDLVRLIITRGDYALAVPLKILNRLRLDYRIETVEARVKEKMKKTLEIANQSKEQENALSGIKLESLRSFESKVHLKYDSNRIVTVNGKIPSLESVVSETFPNCFISSSQGDRTSQEDTHFTGILPLSDQRTIEVTAVFDGHGGKKCSQFVQKNMARYLEKYITQDSPLDIWNGLKIAPVDLSAHFKGDPGTCANITLISGTILYNANIGDSRALLIEEESGKCIQLSKDQKPLDEDLQNSIQKRGGDVYENRLDGILAVARALGDHHVNGINARAKISSYELDRTKSYILLQACDGVFDVLTSDLVARFILERQRVDQETLEKATRSLVAAVIEKFGSTDNVTVLTRRIFPKNQ